MIRIDGSQGEGGGQILRTSLALSMITGEPCRIDNIRAGRPKPGLLRQHLTAVEAAQKVCGAITSGMELRSTSITFKPGRIEGGDFSFAIGTAGSTTLVLQTVLPALLQASSPSTVRISGGTHNTHAPSVRFLERSFLPLLRRMGARVDLRLERHGFYPAGGGCVVATIEPVDRLTPIELIEPTPIVSQQAIATIAGLPPSIAARELEVVRDTLGWDRERLHTEALGGGVGPGNVLSVEIEREDVVEVFTGFGERGVSAERVAAKAVAEVNRYLAADVPVWTYLGDQLMLPLALAGGGTFRTGPLSDHATTNASVIERFLGVRLHCAHDGGVADRVAIVS